MQNQMVLAKIAFAGIAGLLATGCTSLNKIPLVNAERLEYKRTSLVSSAHIVAEGVHVTDTEVTASLVTVNAAYPFVGTIEITVQGYRREK